MRNFLLAVMIAAGPAAASVQPWERLEGQHSGVKETLAVAVQDPQKWADIWRRHDASAPVPEVDFTKESVVVVFLGRTQAAGVKVELTVQQDAIDAFRLNVFYRKTVAKNTFAAQVLCEPYAIVKIRRAATIDVEKDADVEPPERGRAPKRVRDERKMKALILGLEGSSKFD